MSTKTDALESAVTALLQAKTALEAAPGARSRAAVDRAFAHLLARTAPRIRYFTARYGLTDMAEDAAQVCAIALHRAVENYDPARARFTTFINWQLRAELQALRFRMRADQRSAARRVDAVTLSLDAMTAQDTLTSDPGLIDEAAQAATESHAADHLAGHLADQLVAEWTVRRRATLSRACRPGTLPAHAIDRMEEKLAAERALVRHHLTATETPRGVRMRESERHAVRRALLDIECHMNSAKPH